ncbi:hypothetical protein Ocin01_18281 [Orchesella cincta]|uniref:Uncharacterized protein n=1 Tax=Orchesella cincta TaxID=48709 RepID=A0A1D2M655_ORCCI|nr:hypothetical protein Ocin01_18281 [Orchesella cincta]
MENCQPTGDPAAKIAVHVRPRCRWCPPIAIEFYFIIINIICLILSLIGFCYSNYIEKPSYVMKKVDMFHHGGAALLLLIAGILYIASALQIMSMRLHAGRREMRMRSTEKVVAGGLTIIQALIYGAISCFVGKRE